MVTSSWPPAASTFPPFSSDRSPPRRTPVQTAQGNALEWEGGSIDDLVQMLATPALAVRVEVRTPSAGKPRKVGEIHMVAGGVYETIAGGLRGDDAMEHLRGVSPLSFRLQPRLPNPDDGGLLIPGPGEGTLAERSPAELMRYCELYVLTCVLEIWRDTDRAAIHYNKGEIGSTIVNGSEAPDRLAEVINWDSGGYRIVLPELSLPEPPKPAARPQPAAQPSKTMFGYPGVVAAASQPVAVQTASPRTAQPSPSTPAGDARPTPVRSTPVQAVPAKVAPAEPATTEVPAARATTVDPVLEKAAAAKEAAPLAKAEPASTKPEPAKAEPSKPDSRKAEAKNDGRKTESRKTESRKTESRKAEARRTKSRPSEKPAEPVAPVAASKPEASLWPALGLGLVVGLALAAIYWVYRLLTGA